MELQEKLSLLEETFDCDEGFLKPEMVLAETEKWDSMAKLSLIVMVEDELRGSTCLRFCALTTTTLTQESSSTPARSSMWTCT